MPCASSSSPVTPDNPRDSVGAAPRDDQPAFVAPSAAFHAALGFAPTGELEGDERVLELVGAPG
jgi:hypothetical protein